MPTVLNATDIQQHQFALDMEPTELFQSPPKTTTTLPRCNSDSSFTITGDISTCSEIEYWSQAFRSLGLITAEQVLNEIKARASNQTLCPYYRTVLRQDCCKGWSGTNCTEPICTIKCVNGKCTSPEKCACNKGYAGEGCQYRAGDPRLVQCYRKSNCSSSSKISDVLVSIEYCCANQGGIASASTQGSCTLCALTEAEIANITRTSAEKTLPYATCVLWGRDHFRTFDGLVYDFQGTCQYKLAGTVNWEIDLQIENCDQWDTCVKQISSTFGEHRIVTRGHNVTINDVLLEITKGYTSGPLTIERRGEYTYLIYSDGVRMKWDSAMAVYVTVDQTYMKQVTGLCGTYTRLQDDDLELPDGSISTQVTHFANEWRSDSSCQAVAVPTNPCNTAQLVSAAENACKPILDPYDSFKVCLYAINETDHYESCKWDYCSAKGTNVNELSMQQQTALCSAFEAMARECEAHFIHVNWRKSDRCPKACSNDKVYTECASSCPTTCQNHRQDFTSSVDCSRDCSPGCVCPSNNVIDFGRNGSCTPTDQCTCYFHGEYYLPHEKIQIDCNDCICDGGTWNCTRHLCSRTCSVLGMNHIHTFDGKAYTVKGHCEYILVEEMKDLIGLKVKLTNAHDIPADYSKGFYVHFDGIRVYIKLSTHFLNKTRGLCGTYDYNSQNDFMTHIAIVETDIRTFVDDYKTETTCTTPVQKHPCQQNVANGQKAQTICNVLKSDVFSACHSTVNLARFVDACEYDLCSDTSSNHQNHFLCSIGAAYARECRLNNITLDWLSNADMKTACQSAKYGECIGGSAYTDCAPACANKCKDLATNQTCYERECVAGCSCPNQLYLDNSSDKMQCITQENCPCFDVESNTNIKAGGVIPRSCGNCSCSNGYWNCGDQKCDRTIKCPANQVYSSNSSSCPKTCDNMNNWVDCGVINDGCSCPNEQVLSQDLKTCVKASLCPCRYAGRIYGADEVIKRGCSSCKCSGGTWSCEDFKCDATCSAHGDPHYSTFDGYRYSYQGNCKYVLTQTADHSFRVITENVQCGTSGVTCTKNVLITYNNMKISLMRGRDPVVDDVEVTDLLAGRRVFQSVTLMKSGIFVWINSTDFTIKWDGATRIYVTIHDAYKSKMAGLCGNFNGDSSDDLNTANGVPGSIHEMAESWKVEQACETVKNPVMDDSAPCAAHEARKEWAEKECHMIVDTSPTNPFLPCIKKLDETVVRKHYTECLYDACHCDTGGDCECLCTSLSAFAEKCQSINVPVKWRKQDKCPMQCENGQVYMSCGPIGQPTCRDIYSYDNYDPAESGCQEGCFCPDDQVMDKQGHCVKPESCPCVEMGVAYPVGSKTIRNCEECECINATFHCNKLLDCQPKCTQHEFTCNKSLECIPKQWICDKVKDCADESDEMNCKCAQDDFICSNGQCMQSKYRCDGLPNCRDSSDELNCNYTQPCQDFLCDNKHCVPKSWVCDGHIDCSVDGSDHSDEKHCNATPCDIDSGREFRCHDDQSICLPIAQKCDGHVDCLDESDEKHCNCTCEKGKFNCETVCQCVNPQQVCDGRKDCVDGTDEAKCKCGPREYTCNGGLCINSTKLCDRMENCPKGDDETHPSCNRTTTVHAFSTTMGTTRYLTTTFGLTTASTPFCHTMLCKVQNVERCIPYNETCDGERFCDDGKDEIAELFPHEPRCERTTSMSLSTTTPAVCTKPSVSVCGKCLSASKLCDGKCDCPKGCDDEKNCTNCTLHCPGIRSCLKPEQICDNKCDCPADCSDEKDCLSTPPCTEFTCDITENNPIGKCLNKTRLCDGHADCIDKTDEPEGLCKYSSTSTKSTLATTSKSLSTQLTTHLPPVCLNTSSSFIPFSLNSPLIQSVSTPQLPELTKGVVISNQSPLQISKEETIVTSITFIKPFQVMSVIITSSNNQMKISAYTNQEIALLNATISTNATITEYVIQAPNAATQPSNQLIVIIQTPNSTAIITQFLIKACTELPTTTSATPYTGSTTTYSTTIISTHTTHQCSEELGLRLGLIPTDYIQVSSNKVEGQSLDSVRLGNSQLWTAAKDDSNPWIQISFPLDNAQTISGFEMTSDETQINVEFDTLTKRNIVYEDNPIYRSPTTSSEICIIHFYQAFPDIIRIRFTFSRVLSNTVVIAQIELLGCAHFSTLTTPAPHKTGATTGSHTTGKRASHETDLTSSQATGTKITHGTSSTQPSSTITTSSSEASGMTSGTTHTGTPHTGSTHAETTYTGTTHTGSTHAETTHTGTTHTGSTHAETTHTGTTHTGTTGTPGTGTTGMTGSPTPSVSSGTVSGTGGTTTAYVCELTEGMNAPQYLPSVSYTGTSDTSPQDVQPDGKGVTFNQSPTSSPESTISIKFPTHTTPIVHRVSIATPSTNTNVKQIEVVVLAPNKTTLFNAISTLDNPTVTNFPTTAFPSDVTLVVTILSTTDNSPAKNVTISIIACLTPQTTVLYSTSTSVSSTGEQTTTLFTGRDITCQLADRMELVQSVARERDFRHFIVKT
ncbi:unnamed protein product [Didymodactylos carnosus]|uniref:SCO-spondin n=1 Tax=Didymodactylos carnosus TaxID=1234261 RepID=A0A8S2GFJ4_9BILA|nr:unnamed protein product [Didymodactylos carnosus]